MPGGGGQLRLCKGEGGVAGERTGVDDVHGAHGAAGVVEDPLLVVVDVARQADLAAQLVDDEVDDGARVVAVGGDAPLGDIVQLVRLEDVEALEVLVEQVVDGSQGAEQDGDDLEPAAQAARARARRRLFLGRFGWCHCDWRGVVEMGWRWWKGMGKQTHWGPGKRFNYEEPPEVAAARCCPWTLAFGLEPSEDGRRCAAAAKG